MKCSFLNKTIFASEQSIKLFILEKGIKNVNFFHCKACNGYHLTKQEQGSSTIMPKLHQLIESNQTKILADGKDFTIHEVTCDSAIYTFVHYKKTPDRIRITAKRQRG